MAERAAKDGERARRMTDFLAESGWAAAAVTALPGDASFRRYHRLVATDGRRAMLMDAPPPMEDVGPYLLIARHLCALGYSAPRIIAADQAAGLVVIEDFGDDTFARLLAHGARDAALYRLATDFLIDFHARPIAVAVPDGVPDYDDARLLAEAELLVDWYCPAVGRDGESLKPGYLDVWRTVLPVVRAVPESLVLRDFHVDNLMRLDGRAGLAACGLLDFQDAVRGPALYDLVSLLQDARRDVPAEIARAMTARYLAAFPTLDRGAFGAAFAVLAAQRHCKVIGIFTRLWRRDGKPGYLVHIPRVWRLLEAACAHPALAPLKTWLDDEIPPAARRVPEGATAA